MDRRTVLKGAAAACGACLLTACGEEESAAPEAGSSPRGLRASLTRLDEVPVGGAVLATDPERKKVLVTQPTAGTVVAFSAVCTHQGCTVAVDDDHFACPCHGSQFELSGKVRRGPAERPLTPYEVKVVDGQVLPA